MSDLLYNFLDSIGQNNDGFRLFFMLGFTVMILGILAVGGAPLIVMLMTLTALFIFFVAVGFLPMWLVLVFGILMIIYGFISLKGLVNMNGG